MKTIRSRFVSFFTMLIVGCALFACGGDKLKPEHQALVDKYERLIETYEPKFAAVGGDEAQLDKVSDSWAKELELWLREFKAVAPTLSDSEGLAIKASIDKLNRRADKMFMGG
jgi:hypothetical protein